MGVRDDILAIPDEALRTGAVTEGSLVFMDFRDNPQRWWTGAGALYAGAQTWLGGPELISIDSLVAGYSPTAQPVTFRLPASAELVDLSIEAESTVYGRVVVIYGQMFRAQSAEGAWQTIGSPFAHFSGTMEGVRYQFSAESATIILTCEGLFHRRAAPPRGLLTDTDQKARNTGDRGAEYAARYLDYQTRWL